MTWAVVPAAGRGTRFGSETPKQYLTVAGRPLIEHSLRSLLAHPLVDGVMVAISPDDPYWAGWREMEGKPIYTCRGGAERSDSVLSALQALPAVVHEDRFVYFLLKINSANAKSEGVVTLILSSEPSTNKGLKPRRSMAIASSVIFKPARMADSIARVKPPRRNICGVRARHNFSRGSVLKICWPSSLRLMVSRTGAAKIAPIA